jgi:hypothetical protein
MVTVERGPHSVLGFVDRAPQRAGEKLALEPAPIDAGQVAPAFNQPSKPVD